jgi:cyclophilin family peptidyl-prolyl cis-trans isomerase
MRASLLVAIGALVVGGLKAAAPDVERLRAQWPAGPSDRGTLGPWDHRTVEPSATQTTAAANRALLRNPAAPEFTQPAPARAVVRLDTTRGEVLIEVFREWAPLGADRFVNLARYGYYDEARFFRVTAGRWVQFGVSGDPAVAQAWRTAAFADDPFRESNVRGTVAFAFAVPNGRTTQVFVNLRDNSPTHDKEPFVPFGRVVRGMEVFDALNAEHGEGPGGIRAGGQDPFFAGGNTWLDARFPRLDFIRRAVVIREAR